MIQTDRDGKRKRKSVLCCDFGLIVEHNVNISINKAQSLSVQSNKAFDEKLRIL